MYIGGWGVEGCKRQAGDARDAHAHARFGFTDNQIPKQPFILKRVSPFIVKRSAPFIVTQIF